MKTIFTNRAIATVILILSIDHAYCQVGVDTSNPQGIFHVDGKKNNPSTGSPSASQALDDFVVKASGNVGIGTTTPGSKIEINSGLANTSGLRLTQLNTSSPSVNNIKTGVLGVDANGNVVVTKVVDPAVAPCVQGFAFIYEDAVGSSGTISDGTKANALTKKSDPQNIYSNGNFSLKAGDTYRLEAAFFNSYTASAQNVAFSYEWYNV